MNEVEKKSEELLETALRINASDIHFVPRKDDTLIELRVYDHLYELDILSCDFAERIINHFKFRAGMDIGEKRRPQSGSLDVVILHQPIHLRFSTLPAALRESLVIRLLPQTSDIRLNDLSIFSESAAQLESLLGYENGLILFAGPTGSGKTTSMYAMLHAAKRRYNPRIVTLEDPVEKRHDCFIQMEVNEKADLTYQTGFKAILRHDPDIIMIGEIRDLETAKIAVRAAITGHLVFSTIHASDAIGAIHRLLELGIPRFDLKETLVGVVAQRLIHIRCPRCGPVCSPDCPHQEQRNHRRTAIYEILAGLPLHDVLKNGSSAKRRFKRLDDYYRQAAALGYVAPSSDELPIGDHNASS